MTTVSLEESLKSFAGGLTANFASSIPAQPEDQLKPAISSLLTAAGAAFGYQVASRTEAQVTGLGGRPDVGVEVERLLTGYIELKAPGKGARPDSFRGDDQKQWEKFKTLPNLIYTDGTEWTLFRSGVAQGTTLRLAGDVTKVGAAAVTPENTAALSLLLRDFLQWQPIPPSSAVALAQTLAPVRSWLAYRMLGGAGRSSSALDKIRPEIWTAQLTTELLYLLWVLERTVALRPALEEQLSAIIDGPLFAGTDLPQPTTAQRQPPQRKQEADEDAEQAALALTLD